MNIEASIPVPATRGRGRPKGSLVGPTIVSVGAADLLAKLNAKGLKTVKVSRKWLESVGVEASEVNEEIENSNKISFTID